MLWEVISDEDIFKYLPKDSQASIYQLFINNIQGFYNSEKIKTNTVVEMNKKYILLILNQIKKNYSVNPNKITIYEEPVKESITYEEIQNDRRSKFDKDLSKRQEEFEDFMTIKAPPLPNFADKENDSPIKEMDKILKEMQASRNYEIEQINRLHDNNSQTDNWLKPQETSLKTEKFTPVEQSQNYSRFKFLNQDVPESTKDKKNVSFSDIEQVNTFHIEDEEDTNIFSKLKKVSNKQNENNKFEIEESVINEDRIAKLEREVKNMNNKMDMILEILSKKS